MKIAFIAPGYPYRGGISHFATRLAKQISLEHECLYLNFSRLYPKFLFPGKTQFDHSEQALDFPSERIIDSIHPFSWIKAGKTLKRWKADVVIFHWWQPFFGPAYRGIMFNRDKKMTFISICHNVAPHDKGSLWKLAAKFGLRRMDGFVTHARQESEQLTSLLSTDRQLTLFHPIYDIFPNENLPKQEARKILKLKDDDRVLLYFGLIRPYKGVDVLLKAAAEIADIPRMKILLVGEIYSEREKLIDLLKGLPCGMIRMIDWYIPNEEVSTYFRASDLVALPYISATQSGVVPIAYHCHRPVIVTKVGGLPDVVEDGESGYLIEAGDEKELGRAIRNHFVNLKNPDLKDGIERMRQKLGWERYTSRLIDFITELKEK